ncbi:MAG TPA: hypothetical protein VFH38_11860 [Jatrophihabitans sp.]|nr:hypothetical protein [Jatrophihabitans sp.]
MQNLPFVHDTDRPDHDELARLNREPVSFLADIAARSGPVPYDAAFYEAQTVVLQHGTSRRIDRDSAAALCARMVEWARAYESGLASSAQRGSSR